MEGIEKMTQDLQGVVTAKMNEATKNFVSKDEFKAQEDALAAQLVKNGELENALASKDEEITGNKTAIEKLDGALVELKKTHKIVNDDVNENDETLANKIAKSIMQQNADQNFVSKTVFKAGADTHTIDDGVNPAVDSNIRTWFAQLFAGISFRKRSRADWINAFMSVPLVGREVMKLAIKDDAELIKKVGECELKPTFKTEIELYKRRACKVPGSMCFSDEYRVTFRTVFAELLNVLRGKIARSVPRLMAEEIIAQSTDFQNTLGITLPSNSNVVDALEAAICETEEVTGCTIDQIHMSPRTYKLFKNVKDDNGRPLFSCCNGDSNTSIFGSNVTLYENNDLPDVDGIMYLDSSVVNRADSNEITVEEVTDKADKMKNKITYLMETWFGIAIHPCDQACVVYDTLTDIKGALGVS